MFASRFHCTLFSSSSSPPPTSSARRPSCPMEGQCSWWSKDVPTDPTTTVITVFLIKTWWSSTRTVSRLLHPVRSVISWMTKNNIKCRSNERDIQTNRNFRTMGLIGPFSSNPFYNQNSFVSVVPAVFHPPSEVWQNPPDHDSASILWHLLSPLPPLHRYTQA